MKRIFIRSLILLLLFFSFFIVSAYSYVDNISTNIASSVFRLHVVANSNSEEDQNLKYKVRDRLLDYMNFLCSETTTKSEAIEIAIAHASDFQKIAEDVIFENGYDYPVEVEIGKTDFPTKSYGDVSLPAGTYDALNVKIGSSQGQNWWCVMFPPLCFVDISSGIVPDDSKEELEDALDDEEYDLITNSENRSEIKFKFKIIEIFENIKMQLASTTRN